MAAESSWGCYHLRFTHQWLCCWSVSSSLGLCHTHGKDWCASWRSEWSCCRGCARGKRPWPRSARSARSSSVTQSHSNPRSARTEAEDDPGSWGTSLLSSPSHQTPSQDSKQHQSKQVRDQIVVSRSFHLNLELGGEIWQQVIKSKQVIYDYLMLNLAWGIIRMCLYA